MKVTPFKSCDALTALLVASEMLAELNPHELSLCIQAIESVRKREGKSTREVAEFLEPLILDYLKAMRSKRAMMLS